MNRKYLILVLTILIALAYAITASATPTKIACSAGTAESWSGGGGCNYVAQGGNITPLNMSVNSQTNAWQGFYGEVTGNITLRDNSGDQMYSWSGVNITGEVYASVSNGVNWAGIVGVTVCTADEALTGTGTDRTNNTFTRNASLVIWNIGNVAINDSCQTYTYVNNASQTTSFEEIIVSDGVNNVYATKIDSNTAGFDGNTHDYQLIVPDNTTIATTTYYFYAELG